MNSPRPPWEFRSGTDRLKFKAWVKQLLDQMDEPTAEDIRRDAEMINDAAYNNAVEKEIKRTIKRGRVINAARVRDERALEQLTANDLALKDLALRVAVRKPGRGRKKGEARPGCISPEERDLLEAAVHDLARIRWICKNHWGRWKGIRPVALDIAAERNHVGVERLISFKKNSR